MEEVLPNLQELLDLESENKLENSQLNTLSNNNVKEINQSCDDEEKSDKEEGILELQVA